MTILDKYAEHKAHYAYLKGFEQGFEKGIEQGIEKVKFETAKAMLKDNINIALIHKYTSLSMETLESLRINSENK